MSDDPLEVCPTLLINFTRWIGEGGIHLYPEVFLRELAAGEHDPAEHHDLLRAVLAEWLELVPRTD